MGLFSSIDNSKQINDAYVKKQLNNRDRFLACSFGRWLFDQRKCKNKRQMERMDGWMEAPYYGTSISK